MRNMLRLTAAWFTEKVGTKPAEIEPVKLTVAEVPVAEEPVREPQDEVAPRAAENLPKLTIRFKASAFYAVCPHCESTWNLGQRLVDPRFQRLFPTHGLTCPCCDKAVALPTADELRRRH